MEPKRVIFISAVSNEFHRVLPEQRQSFQSYRDVLKQAFRILAPHYEVVVQEDLVHGFGDLLETLEHEVARSLLVIHLVGDLAGLMPGPGALRSLHTRRPDLLARIPELSAAVGDGEGVTYTQWELYLAFHHGQHPLIFQAQPGVPRSPFFAPTTFGDLHHLFYRHSARASTSSSCNWKLRQPAATDGAKPTRDSGSTERRGPSLRHTFGQRVGKREIGPSYRGWALWEWSCFGCEIVLDIDSQ